MENRVAPDRIKTLLPGQIFVFGSNLMGCHGGGAARQAMEWGAMWGKGVGPEGQTYAIPTMFTQVKEIEPYVEDFIRFAREHSENTFIVSKLGCGIAGFTPEQMAPLFADAVAIENIWLPQDFWDVLLKG